jgi:hypothetical protein
LPPSIKGDASADRSPLDIFPHRPYRQHMKRKLLIGLGTASCVLLAVALASARDDGPPLPDHSLSDFSLGDHISGEETDLSKLDGKVVAIEYWGTR